MTETPPPPSGAGEQPAGSGAGTDTRTETRSGPGPGVDRQHLTNYEQLRRSTTDRKIAGVAGGLGRHLNVDPTVLRVVFVVLALFSGAGLVLYAAAWLLVPEEGREGRSPLHVDDSTRNIVLIVVGAIAALIVIGHSWSPVGFGFPWPLLLLGILVFVWLTSRERRGRSGAPGAATSPSRAPDPSGPDYSVLPGDAAAPPVPPWAPADAAAYEPYQPPRKPAKRGPKLFGFTVAAVLVALGTLGLFDWAGADVVDSAYPALALAVIGAMLLVGAFVGRAGGLIALGLVASLALAGTAVAGLTGEGDNLKRHPHSATHVAASYSIKAGRAYVDLSDLDHPRALAGRVVDIGGRVGEIVLVLPQGVQSVVHASIAGPGGIDFPDDSRGGMGSSITSTYGTGAQRVTFRLHLKAGHIDVRKP